MSSGELRPGDRLPPHRELAYRLGVATATVSRAYGLAGRWGLLTARVGSGTRVAQPPEAQIRAQAVSDDMIDMSYLRPAPCGSDALRRRMYVAPLAQVGTLWAKSDRAYPPELGLDAHREVGAAWLSRGGARATAETTLVCDGAQQAFLLAMAATTRMGDAVLLEAHAYLGFKDLCESARRVTEPVALDQEGVVPEALDAAAARTGARLVFLTPTLQNPTGAVASEDRRRRLAAVARKRDLTLVESDPFSELAPERRPPIARFAPERTFYVRSLSKYAAPATPVAFMSAPAAMIPHLEARRRGMSAGGSGLAAALAVMWLRSGLLNEIIAAQRTEIARRQAVFRGRLGAASGLAPSWSPFLWIPAPSPLRAHEVAQGLARSGVRVFEDERFAVGRVAPVHCVRLALTTEADSGRLQAAAEAAAAAFAASGAPVAEPPLTGVAE